MKQETRFTKDTTLRQVIDELEKNGLTEITRVTFEDDGVFFEYEIEDSKE